MQLFARAKSVLVADDEKDICLYLKRYLERKRMKVTTCLDGQEAKDLIEKHNFDYFLLDCSMPNITGLELISLARQRNPQSKIILISGFPSVNEAVIRQLGGDTFIHKPIQMAEIDSILKD